MNAKQRLMKQQIISLIVDSGLTDIELDDVIHTAKVKRYNEYNNLVKNSPKLAYRFSGGNRYENFRL